MNIPPKIISLVACLFYGAVIIDKLFAFALKQGIPYYVSVHQIPLIFAWFYHTPAHETPGILIFAWFGILGVPLVSNLAYYLFLRKRSRENRLPKYAISIALLLALAPVALVYGVLSWVSY